MFDARSILDILLGGPGAGRPQGRPVDSTVFRDMLDQLGDQPSTGRPPAAGAPQQAPGGRGAEPRYGDPRYPQDTSGQARQPVPGGGMSLEDLLRSILTGAPAQAGPQQRLPRGGPQPAPGGQAGPAINPEVGRELQDLLRQILQGARGPTAPGAPGGQASRLIGEGGQTGAGGFAEALRQLLGQPTAGAREGAAKIDGSTGLSSRARETLAQTTGQTPEELVAKLKELIANNQLASGAALGGLGALVLGTSAGRSLAASAIKLGGLALIGGLAYKAYQNYQRGGPPIASDRPGDKQTLLPAPQGSGFEPDALTHDSARRCIRVMIAAAAADGRIDAAEQQKILGGLKQAGIEDAAQRFLAAEISNPATAEELASGVSSPEEAVQIYTAARIAIDPDTHEEQEFLASLAEALGIDDELVAQVDAAARGAAA